MLEATGHIASGHRVRNAVQLAFSTHIIQDLRQGAVRPTVLPKSLNLIKLTPYRRDDRSPVSQVILYFFQDDNKHYTLQ